MPDNNFIGSLNGALMSPMVQGGLGLLSGQGAEGMQQGLLASQKMQAQQMQNDQARRSLAFMQNLQPNDPRFKGLPTSAMALATGTQDAGILGNAVTRKMDIDAAVRQQAAMMQLQLQMMREKTAVANGAYPQSIMPNGQPQAAGPSGGVRVWNGPGSLSPNPTLGSAGYGAGLLQRPQGGQ